MEKLKNILDKLGAWEHFKRQIYSQYRKPVKRHLAENFGNEKDILPSQILFEALDWNHGGMYDFWADVHSQLKKNRL